MLEDLFGRESRKRLHTQINFTGIIIYIMGI